MKNLTQKILFNFSKKFYPKPNPSKTVGEFKPATGEEIKRLPADFDFEQPYLRQQLLNGEMDIKELLESLEKPKNKIKNPEAQTIEFNDNSKNR
jgi:hypothetical protein